MPTSHNNKTKSSKMTTTTVRIRSVGPMVLENYTNDELTHLRQAVSSQNSKIKYLALAFNKADKSIQVVAQAHEKLSAPAWREVLWRRLKITGSTGNLMATIETLRKNPGGFEEYGLFGRHSTYKPSTAGTAEESVEEEDPPKPEARKQEYPKLAMVRRCAELYHKQRQSHKLEAKSKQRFDSGKPIADPETVVLDRKRPQKSLTQLNVGMRDTFLKRLKMYQSADRLDALWLKRPELKPVAKSSSSVKPVKPVKPVEPIKPIVEPVEPVVEPVVQPVIKLEQPHDINLFLSALANSEGQDSRVTARDLFKTFEQFHLTNGFKVPLKETAFGCEIKGIQGFTGRRTSSGQFYTWDRAVIKQYLVDIKDYESSVKIA